MAVAEKSTTEEMILRVAGLIDSPVDNDSIPSNDNVVSWLNEAALLLAKLLPTERLAWCSRWDETENVGERQSLEGRDLIRLVSVVKYGASCTKKTHAELLRIRRLTPAKASVKTPFYAVVGHGGNANLRYLPMSRGKVELSFVRKPTAYAIGATPDDYSVPAELEQAVVDFAVIRAKIQDEEPQQVQLLMQGWGQLAGIEVKADAIGADD